MIEVEHLTKYYGNILGVEDVSFKVEKGEILGFLGPNGSGKTTTMRILTGFMPATNGRARVAGYDVFRDSLEVRRRVGYMPETVPLYTDMTVRSYLDFMAEIKGIDRRKKRGRIADVITLCRVEEYADTIIGKLSKGFRQRVGLAQAILQEPEVLILDEPTIGLDPRQVVEARQLIKELGKHCTIILSTHILPEVGMVCGRVIIINRGHIVAVDTPENLNARLQGGERIELEVRGPAREVLPTLRRIDGVRAVTLHQGDGVSRYTVECAVGQDLRERLAAGIVQNGWGLLGIRHLGMSLEEIFVQLVTEEVA